MFELASLSTFLDILQKGFGLLEKRKIQKRRLFEEIVEPVYKELTLVVGDYYKFLRTCRDEFSQAEVQTWELVLNKQRRNREDIVMARSKVLGITQPFLSEPSGLDKEQDALMLKFAKAIKEFFYASDGTDSTTTHATTLFNTIDDVVARGSKEKAKL